jgi:hypothetical protein
MSYRYHDQTIPVSLHSWEWSTHRYVGIGNEMWACVYCLDCDAHARECPELSPKGA